MTCRQKSWSKQVTRESLQFALRPVMLKQLQHPLSARHFRLVSLGSQSQLAEHMFGLLERAVAFPLGGELLEVGVSQRVGKSCVSVELLKDCPPQVVTLGLAKLISTVPIARS